jgi:hypothetical protein
MPQTTILKDSRNRPSSQLLSHRMVAAPRRFENLLTPQSRPRSHRIQRALSTQELWLVAGVALFAFPVLPA